MGRLTTARRVAGLAGAAVGIIAAGGAMGVLAERKAIPARRSRAAIPFGSLRGARCSVFADDGLELYAEVDEPDGPVAQVAGPTLVFVHGYALNLDSWHFQREDLRGEYRMVFYDQRSHGRSARSPAGHCTFDQLGRDLLAVIDQLAGDGPVILLGHSMGGMTIMALMEQQPQWFGERIAGVGLLSTSAGGLQASTLGLPGLPGRVLHRFSPALLATLARAPRLVASGRRAGSDIGFAVTRSIAFGGAVPDEYVDFVDEMLAATPIDVVADFFPGFDSHDKYAALGALAGIPTVVIGGTKDAITPYAHTRQIAERLPSAEILELTGCGHMSLIERHIEVNAALRRMLDKVAAGR